MVVILAGCDGTGKSTCFNRLRESISANFIKESYVSSFEKRRIRALFTSSKITDGDLTIYDRATILDDLVYDPVMTNRESSLITAFGGGVISCLLNRCLIIYLDLDDCELTKRLESRGDDYVSAHQINKIKNSYKTIFERYNICHERVDVTGLSEDDVYNTVKGIIDKYEESKNSSNSSC